MAEAGTDPEEESPRASPGVPGSLAGDPPDAAGWYERRTAPIRARVGASADWAEAKIPIWWLLRDAWDRYWRLNGAVLAGHLAFRTFVWLLPVAFMVVALAGFLRAEGSSPDEVIGQPLGLGAALGESLRQAGSDTSDSWYHVAWVSGAGVLMGSLGLYSGLHYVFLQLWEIPYQKVARRASSTLRFTGGFVILLGSTALIRMVRNQSLLLHAGTLLMLAVLAAAAFAGLSVLLPRRSTGFISLLPGAVVGAIGVTALQFFAAVYLPNRMASFSATYGVLGVAATFIFYLYLVGSIIVVATIVNGAWWDHFHPGSGTPPVGSQRSFRLPAPPERPTG